VRFELCVLRCAFRILYIQPKISGSRNDQTRERVTANAKLKPSRCDGIL